jgi:hypothetical protein
MIGLNGYISIRLVTYNEDGQINGWNMIPVSLEAEHISDVWDIYENLGNAFLLPVIMERDLENQFLEAGKVAVPLEEEE